MKIRRRRHTPVAALVSLVAAVAAIVSPVHAQPMRQVLEGLDGRLAKLAKKTKALERRAGRPLSVEAHLASLGRKASLQKIFFSVRDGIAYEPYRGAQRGARGTLIAKAGNSADQSALLLRLLELRGIDARVAYGRLSNAEAARRVRASVGSASLAGRGLPPKMESYDPGRDTAAVNAAREAVWVEAKVKGKWVALDPSNPKAVVGVAPVPKEGDGAGLPAHVKVMVSVELTAKARGGAATKVFSARVPAADIAYRNTTVAFVRSKDSMTPKVMVAGKSQTGKAFAKDQLARLTLTLVFERAGKVDRKLSRDLFLRGSAVDLLAADQQVFSVVVIPSWVGERLLARASAGALADLTKRAGSVGRQITSRARGGRHGSGMSAAQTHFTEDVLGTAAGLIALTTALVSDRATIAFAEDLGVHPYYVSPRVSIVAGLRRTGTLLWHADLRSDEIAVIPARGISPRLADALQVLRGAMDAELITSISTEFTGSPMASVGKLFGSHGRRGQNLTLFSGNAAAVTKRLKASKEVRARLLHLAKRGGRAALVAGAAGSAAWWELDPDTGAIIGTREDGARGGFSQDLSASADGRSWRADNAVIPALDAAVSLLDNLSTGIVAVLKGGDVSCRARCSLDLQLAAIQRDLCGDGSPRAQRCLAPTTTKSSADLFGKTQTCEALAARARCGTAVAREALKGAYSTVDDQRPARVGPWSRSSASSQGCRCPR